MKGLIRSCPGSGLSEAVVRFCRFVRASGLSPGPNETIHCLQALDVIKNPDPDSLKYALRAVLCSSREEFELFDDLFSTFWLGSEEKRQDHSGNPGKMGYSTNSSESKRDSIILGGAGHRSPFEEDGASKSAFGASACERLHKVDFSQVPQTDLAELERISTRLLRRMSYRVSRSLRPRKCTRFVDLRRTIRRGVSHGGELIELSYRGPKRERARLVILLDVSDSMNLYSLFLFKFAYALGRHSRTVESFIFSTNLVAVTDMLKARRLSDAFAMLSKTTTGWSGGTRIGGSLQEFNRLYAGKVLSRNTVFLIMSDGWDTGMPEVLTAELRKIRSRVRKLIWLNPLLGLDEYQPVTRGMSSALPYIDVFAPAHNLQSLLELEKFLRPGMTA